MSGVNGPGLSQTQLRRAHTLQSESMQTAWKTGGFISQEKFSELSGLLGKMNPEQKAQVHQMNLLRMSGRLREQAVANPELAPRLNAIADKLAIAGKTPESAAQVSLGGPFRGSHKGLSNDEASFIRQNLLSPEAREAQMKQLQELRAKIGSAGLGLGGAIAELSEASMAKIQNSRDTPAGEAGQPRSGMLGGILNGIIEKGQSAAGNLR